MENRAHAIVAICFLIVFAAGAVVVYLWLTSGPSEPLAYQIVTDQSVGGLVPQSKVQFKGLQVGHVTRIRFDPADHRQVVVDFTVRRGTYVTHATYAELAMQGLAGGEALELKLGQGSAEHLHTSTDHPAQIPLRQGLLAGLESSGEQDMKDIHQILASVNKVLDTDNREHISASIRQIDAATAKLVAIETQLMPAIKQMPTLAENAQHSLKQSQALLTDANRLAKEARVPVRKAGKLEDSVQQLSRKLDRQTVPNVDALSSNLLRTSHKLDQLLRELRAKPQSLIFGPPQPPPGPGEPGFNDARKGAKGHE